MVIPQASEGISGIKFRGIQHQKYTKVFIYYPPTVNSLDWKIDRQKWLDGIYATHLQSQVSTAIVATQYELPRALHPPLLRNSIMFSSTSMKPGFQSMILKP